MYRTSTLSLPNANNYLNILKLSDTVSNLTILPFLDLQGNINQSCVFEIFECFKVHVGESSTKVPKKKYFWQVPPRLSLPFIGVLLLYCEFYFHSDKDCTQLLSNIVIL